MLWNYDPKYYPGGELHITQKGKTHTYTVLNFMDEDRCLHTILAKDGSDTYYHLNFGYFTDKPNEDNMECTCPVGDWTPLYNPGKVLCKHLKIMRDVHCYHKYSGELPG